MTVPVSLYFHIPWCVRKCPYCDFNSHESKGPVPEAAYVDALIADLDTELQTNEVSSLHSIFIGGGTPSLFSPASFARLLDFVANSVTIAADTEITMEANPGTAEGVQQFKDFRAAGINRLSIGVQSFDDRALGALGRIHDGGEATRAFELARHGGFDNINLDLMHGLPGQAIDGALVDLDHAIALAPEHISWYQLTIEPNTVFYKRPPALPDEDTLWNIYEAGMMRLAEAGYARYEVSAFAKANRQSAHNLNYWRFGDYVGIGAGAHGKRTRGTEVMRTAKTRMPADYLLRRDPATTSVPSDELPLEFLMNALRLVDGFDLGEFETRTSLPRSTLDAFVSRAQKGNLIEITDEHVSPTSLGLQYLNELLMMVDGVPLRTRDL